mmetsp:Transcript_7989/g.14443  ORF Transcript_7989/g.14443 Transcript_7989/m.14443 type:complete len:126 (-) Transcript_7989:1959-2336(-)
MTHLWTSKLVNHSAMPRIRSMDESGHELCYISHTNLDRRLRCNTMGHISIYSDWIGSDLWRFIGIDDGVFIIASCYHDHKMLCSAGEGVVFTTEKKQRGLKSGRSPSLQIIMVSGFRVRTIPCPQ